MSTISGFLLTIVMLALLVLTEEVEVEVEVDILPQIIPLLVVGEELSMEPLELPVWPQLNGQVELAEVAGASAR